MKIEALKMDVIMYLNIFPQSPTTDPASPRRSCVSAPPASLCAQTALTPTLLSLCYWSLAVNLVSGLRHSRPQPAAAACLRHMRTVSADRGDTPLISPYQLLPFGGLGR